MRGALAQIQAQALHDPICHLWGTKIAHYKLLTHISASNSGQSTDVWGWRDTVDFLSRHLSFSLDASASRPQGPHGMEVLPHQRDARGTAWTDWPLSVHQRTLGREPLRHRFLGTLLESFLLELRCFLRLLTTQFPGLLVTGKSV